MAWTPKSKYKDKKLELVVKSKHTYLNSQIQQHFYLPIVVVLGARTHLQVFSPSQFYLSVADNAGDGQVFRVTSLYTVIFTKFFINIGYLAKLKCF